MWEKLQYPRTRQKRSATALEDIFDGSEYKRLQQEGEFLSDPNNLTYTFNFDGCKATKKGSLKIWPGYARINELPPDMRQKFSFVIAVFVDHCDPNFHSFLKPIVKQLNHLSSRGIIWTPHGNNQITTKFAPLCECVDAPARAGMLHMSLYNAQFGCTFCTHRGVHLEHSQRCPIINVEGLPEFADRTHNGMRDGMTAAQEFIDAGQIDQVPFQGHHGTSPLLLLQHHDLRAGQAVDDLHQDHEGCAADITKLLVTLAPRVPLGMPYIQLVREIDQRLLQFKTPSRMSRKPRSIKDRGKFNGSEWRNWLFFFAVPCLSGLIEQQYVDMTFGVFRLKYNLHVTTSHKVTSVRQLGPPYCTSTYNFESLNCKLTKFVTSPKGAAMQILTRSLLNMTVHSAQYDERISESVRERLQHMLNKERLKNVLEVGPNLYMVGKSVEREVTPAETQVLLREGFPGVINFHEYKSVLIGHTRYQTVRGQNPDSRSDDTHIFTQENTYCTIQKAITFTSANGEEGSGLIVLEHEVQHNHPIAQHLSVIRPDGDLLHFLPLDRVRCPVVAMTVGNVKYLAAMPNCLELD
ncbi:hypothetical protein FOCC_FOCC011013 [Frankliniella occidentalis]|nr:hypothetical protein FOCC_FOCC011013 [Frankliniella occidentalis]